MFMCFWAPESRTTWNTFCFNGIDVSLVLQSLGYASRLAISRLLSPCPSCTALRTAKSIPSNNKEAMAIARHSTNKSVLSRQPGLDEHPIF
eukprot:1733209-Amphidinium_carterae.1